MRDNGFTLVELLASMAVGSLLLISLGWATGQISRDVGPSPADKEISETAAAASLFQNIVEHRLLSPDSSESIDVDDRRLLAIIPAPAALGAVDPLKIELTVRQDEDGAALYARMLAVRAPQRLPDPVGDPTRIAGGFKTIRFVSEEADAGPGPAAIQLVLEGRESRSIWARPRITSSGACIFDAIVGRCR